jgi:hypothetical protein
MSTSDRRADRPEARSLNQLRLRVKKRGSEGLDYGMLQSHPPDPGSYFLGSAPAMLIFDRARARRAFADSSTTDRLGWSFRLPQACRTGANVKWQIG